MSPVSVANRVTGQPQKDVFECRHFRAEIDDPYPVFRETPDDLGDEIVTVIEGEGATPADTRRITEWLAEHRPDVSAEVHHGGQPLYPYLVSVE